ncbi:hypothetical protein Taro_023068, partial [Colocasia esculenta]|nr:hypothetical protein [Colocasia esculenta]
MTNKTSWPTQAATTETTRSSPRENLHPKAPRAILGEPHQDTAQPNGTLQTAGATQRWPETITKHSWEELPPEATKGDPGKSLHQDAQPNDTDHQREHCSKQNCRSNTSQSWENLHQNHQGTALGTPSRTHQPNQQKQHTSDSEVAQQQQKRARNGPERNPHQDNSKQFWETSPKHRATSDAPQPRGQRNNNQKRAQHSSGETSLPPEPTEKNSRSTSL